jgi:hypothetical protein
MDPVSRRIPFLAVGYAVALPYLWLRPVPTLHGKCVFSSTPAVLGRTPFSFGILSAGLQIFQTNGHG